MLHQNKTLGDLVENRYNRSIASDGIDMINETVNGESFTRNTPRSAALRAFVKSKSRQALAFVFGSLLTFRNDSINKETGERENIFWTLLKDLAWWPEADMATGLRIAQSVAMTLLLVTGVRLAYVALQIATTLVMNVARLALESFTGVAFDGFDELQKRARARLADTNPATKPGKVAEFFYNVADMALDAPRAVFGLLHFVGRAIVSPIDGARQARKDFGLLGAVVSGTVTTVAYIIAFPFVVAYGSALVSTYVTPLVSTYITGPAATFLTANAPAFMTKVIAPVSNLVNSLSVQATLFMTSARTAQIVGMIFNPILGLVPASVSTALGLTAMNAAIVSVATVALTTVGLAASKAYNAIRFAISAPKVDVFQAREVLAALDQATDAANAKSIAVHQENAARHQARLAAGEKSKHIPKVLAPAAQAVTLQQGLAATALRRTPAVNHRDKVVIDANEPVNIDGHAISVDDQRDYRFDALRTSKPVIELANARELERLRAEAQAQAEAKRQAAAEEAKRQAAAEEAKRQAAAEEAKRQAAAEEAKRQAAAEEAKRQAAAEEAKRQAKAAEAEKAKREVEAARVAKPADTQPAPQSDANATAAAPAPVNNAPFTFTAPQVNAAANNSFAGFSFPPMPTAPMFFAPAAQQPVQQNSAPVIEEVSTTGSEISNASSSSEAANSPKRGRSLSQ